MGILIGYRNTNDFVGLLYLMLAGWCVYLSLDNDYTSVFSLFPYLIYSELFIRAYVPFVPYLFMPYLYITIIFLLMLQNRTNWRLYTKSFVLLFFFIIIEYVNSIRSTLPDIARGLLVNSLALMMVATWGAYNIITPVMANRILKNLKYASVYLCGIVIARYLVGDVEFGTHSGSEGTNGLAPVQISGYLGVSCSIFFFSVMNDQERRHLIINLFFFAMSAVVMMLSFSRGGVYFVGIIMILYFLFNRSMIKSYFLLLLLIPVGLGVYSYVNDTTGGLIGDRYEQEGSSGRDQLAEAGWQIFREEPIAGVGPANYSNEIVKRGFYATESGVHNEFIRVAAEDGILGIITYWGFFIVLGLNILKRRKIQREYAIYFLVLYCLIVVHNGLKISIQPFLILLAVATHSVNFVAKKKHVPNQPQLAAGPA